MKLILLALFLSSCTPKQATPPAPATAFSTITSIGTWGDISPAPAPIAAIPAQSVTLEKSCPAAGVNVAVDVSEPVTQKFLFAMRQLKVSTVFRYFDLTNETLPGKTITAKEAALIRSNGLSIGVVFQHNNSSPNTFAKTQDRGTTDAKRSLDIAATIKQPKSSAIFFGVDFEPNSAQLQDVLRYATNFSNLIRAAGYKVGVYGSGDTLKMLKTARLVDYTWISQSTGFSGTKALTASKQYSLLQGMPKDCGGKNVDFDSGVSAFGQFQ
jgi:hypothetical protein